MILDSDKLGEAAPAEILLAAARGHVGLDHRFLHALLDRPEEAIPAVVEFTKQDLENSPIDLSRVLIDLFRYWKTPASIPFLIEYVRQDPEDLPDDLVFALVENAETALEPLLTLFHDLDETDAGDVAFLLASLGIRDERILELLIDRLEYDFPDTLILLGLYGDPAARPAIEKAAADISQNDASLEKEVTDTLARLSDEKKPREAEPFDIWQIYPDEDDPPIDDLPMDEREELLKHPKASIRAAAAHSFFNRSLTKEQSKALLALAQADEAVEVKARAWEALIDSTEEPEVAEAMLHALRTPELDVIERGGLVVGLAPEIDRNEVREAIAELYKDPKGRAKALEAMWRSVHPSFRGYFAKHLDDDDLEIRRAALWGVGYFGLKAELGKLRALFDHEDLRTDALFAYALALPAEISKGRMNGLLARIEKDARGLSEMEEELVKVALDERLMLAGKEPFFQASRD